ncbi:hypothetical protein KY366_03495 [Candidatus Woesearchaeota archaeon]|nr:hypothetical protein [Candidatus Woesearchaeota archaeon]
MNQEQKERLEQELEFLKESLESEVISNDEFERGKERIERKLREIADQSPDEEKSKDDSKEESSEEAKEGKEEPEEPPEEKPEERESDREEEKPEQHMEEQEPEESKEEDKTGQPSTGEETEEDSGEETTEIRHEEKSEEPEEPPEEEPEERESDNEEPKQEEPEESKEEHEEEEKPGQSSDEEKPKQDLEEEPPEEAKEGKEEPEEPPEEKPEEKESEKEEPKHEKPEESKEEQKEEVKKSRKGLYWTIVLIIFVILFFSIRGCGRHEEKAEITLGEEEFIPACSVDSDCQQEGMVSVCLNPDTKESECEYQEDVRIELIAINYKGCRFCDDSTVKTIIKEMFPNVKVRDVDYNAPEARELINRFGIKALPAYIFDSNVSKAVNFEDFSSALVKNGDSYLLSETASGAAYYFKRPMIRNKLDLYLLPGDNRKIEDSMSRVSELFAGKMDFTRHIVTEQNKESLKKELAINTYPTFLLNNQLKFRGILPADTIKERICSVNAFNECGEELPKI